MKETDIGQFAASYLHDLGWTLSYEVEIQGLIGRPDIVGVRGPMTLICECKTTMGLAVMEQAFRHIGRAHYVYIATPYTRRSATVERWLQREGVGWLWAGRETQEHVAPRLYRTASTAWTRHLKPEHQTELAPGSAGGGYFTPFVATCRAVRDFVAKHPGANTSDVVRGIQHHYRRHSTAVSCLAKWGREGKIPGVVVDGNTWGVA